MFGELANASCIIGNIGKAAYVYEDATGKTSSQQGKACSARQPDAYTDTACE